MGRIFAALIGVAMAGCATAQAVDYGEDAHPHHAREAPAPDSVAPVAEAPPPPTVQGGVPPLASGFVIKQCHLIEGHIRHCEAEAYTGKAPAPQQGSWRLCDIDHGHIGICLRPIEGSAIVDQDGVVRECDLVAGVPVNCIDPGFSGDAPVPAPQ